MWPIVGWFAEVYRRRVLKSMQGSECEVHGDGICLEHILEFKYWGVFRKNQVQMDQNVVGM